MNGVLLGFLIFVGCVVILIGVTMYYLRDRLFSHHADDDPKD